MSLILSILLASPQALPFIDRAALHTQAKFEAAQAVRSVEGVRTTDRLSKLCRAASALAPPADFAIEIRRAYSMTGPEVSILKTTCSSYLVSAKTMQSVSLAAR